MGWKCRVDGRCWRFEDVEEVECCGVECRFESFIIFEGFKFCFRCFDWVSVVEEDEMRIRVNKEMVRYKRKFFINDFGRERKLLLGSFDLKEFVFIVLVDFEIDESVLMRR